MTVTLLVEMPVLRTHFRYWDSPLDSKPFNRKNRREVYRDFSFYRSTSTLETAFWSPSSETT